MRCETLAGNGEPFIFQRLPDRPERVLIPDRGWGPIAKRPPAAAKAGCYNGRQL